MGLPKPGFRRMKRRNILIGMGGFAAGASALVGSGAFTSMSAGRTVSVEVTGDNSAFLRMTPVVHRIEGVPDGEAPVYFDGGATRGQLGIDTSRARADGVNNGAITWIGTDAPEAPGSWVEESNDNIDWVGHHNYTPRAAFGIENRGTQEYELTLDYEYDGEPGDSEVTFPIYEGAHPDIGTDNPERYGTLSATDSVTVAPGNDDESFGFGKRIFASMKIDTTNGSPDDDLSGSLSIRAKSVD